MHRNLGGCLGKHTQQFYPRDVITQPEVLNCGLVQDKEVSLVAAVSH